MNKVCENGRKCAILSWLRLYIADLIILVMVWGGFYRCTLANSDSLWGMISKEATLNASIENFRWLGFVGDAISYALHYYPFEHQKLNLILFLIVMAASLLLTQMTFTRVLKDRLSTDRDWVIYIAITTLCYVNVLIAELFYFADAFLRFKMAMLCAALGCYWYSRKRLALGTVALFITPMFYQVSCVQAALVLCTLAILEERGEFTTRLVRKELVYILVPMCSGLLNYVTGPYIMPLMSRLMHEENNVVAKRIVNSINTETIIELRDLYESSLGLMMPVYLPLLFSLIITAAVIYSVRKNTSVLLTYIVYKVVAMVLTLGVQMLSDPREFIPRLVWVFYVMQSMNAILALHYVDHKMLRRGVKDLCVVYVLAQAFFIQVIIANRGLSEYLDRMYANQILDNIEEHERETGVQITTISIAWDERVNKAYDGVYFYRDAINTRLYEHTAYTLLETFARERGRSFIQVDGVDPQIIEEYYAGHDWDEMDLDEQIVYQGDTVNICVF